MTLSDELRDALVQLGVDAARVPATLADLDDQELLAFVTDVWRRDCNDRRVFAVVAELLVLRRESRKLLEQIHAYDGRIKDQLAGLGKKMDRLEKHGARVRPRHRRRR